VCFLQHSCPPVSMGWTLLNQKVTFTKGSATYQVEPVRVGRPPLAVYRVEEVFPCLPARKQRIDRPAKGRITQQPGTVGRSCGQRKPPIST
jgi:hypothetical protein